jgi:hypothetical protein
LQLAKAPADALGSVVRGFPRRMVEEVAELLETRGIYRLDDLLEWGEVLIRAGRTPRLIARLSLHYGAALPVLINPEAVPVLQKAARHAKCATNWTGQRFLYSVCSVALK